MIDKTLEMDLYNHKIYDAWQFVLNTSKAIGTAKYCRDLISDLIEKMSNEHDEWKNNLFNDLMHQENELKKVSITTEGLPDFQVKVSNIEVPVVFLLNKTTKDFFQYIRNSFDSMAQVSNAALLANKAKKIDTVDFPKMLSVFNQQTYSNDFPGMSLWYNDINLSSEFSYIDAFNNRSKHTLDIYLKVSMDLIGSQNVTKINPFFRKDIQHQSQDVISYLDSIYQFTLKSFEEFLGILKDEYVKEKYVENRSIKLKAHQQKMLDSPNSDYSVVYFESEEKHKDLPDEIQILFLNKIDEEIWSKNCEIETILVRNKEENYSARYKAENSYGNDNLLKYRKYRKDDLEGQIVLFEEMSRQKNNTIFYLNNPYIDVQTVSDDKTFIQRVQLPF
ncbi:hypothetical protein [Paenibacillus xylanexedens]|uniref:Uncharacterized protein n=1 Tax=Paenibacillus xylanexedens TaxID=528191 RepID=A0ABS4RMY6_PAEXY|nr:hypothetical protein [Paenibacillus xylanexedens]MBP2244263.1 hypothetical protein [Paenibacillus xylanexedens]